MLEHQVLALTVSGKEQGALWLGEGFIYTPGGTEVPAATARVYERLPYLRPDALPVGTFNILLSWAGELGLLIVIYQLD